MRDRAGQPPECVQGGLHQQNPASVRNIVPAQGISENATIRRDQLVEERVDCPYRRILQQGQELFTESLLPNPRVAAPSPVIACGAGLQSSDAPSQPVPHLVGCTIGESQQHDFARKQATPLPEVDAL